MLPTEQARLLELAQELDRLARTIYGYVPENPDRYDRMLEAYNRVYGAKAECERAAGCLKSVP